jgi:hypothetical protein
VTLEEIFEQGHRIACSRNPVRHVMLLEETEERPAGYYFLEEEEVEVAAVRKRVDETQLGRRVSVRDLLKWRSTPWFPASDHCWCEQCTGTRQFRSTLTD